MRNNEVVQAMMTIKEYAIEKGISYEAVRKQIERYYSDLEKHITKRGRTQYLDDEAIEYLNARRKESPIIVANEARATVRSDLEEESAKLHDQIDMLKNRVIELQQKLLDAQNELVRAAETTTKYTALLESNTRVQEQLSKAEIEREQLRQAQTETAAQLEQVRSERDRLHTDTEDLRQELSSFRPSLFGFYRKKK